MKRDSPCDVVILVLMQELLPWSSVMVLCVELVRYSAVLRQSPSQQFAAS